MNDLFNILIFSKDYNQGVIIQDYIKAIGYNSQVFDQEEAAYEGFLSRNFTLCIINHDIDTKETRTLAAMIKSSENIIPVVFLCEHPTREEIALLFSFHADLTQISYKPGLKQYKAVTSPNARKRSGLIFSENSNSTCKNRSCP